MEPEQLAAIELVREQVRFRYFLTTLFPLSPQLLHICTSDSAASLVNPSV